MAQREKLHLLITAGPTREYLDPVRFLTNGSTGQMGYACAAAAARRGHRVTLISGPVNLPRPEGVRRVDVLTAADMARAVYEHFPSCSGVIMTAAVCDYRPAETSSRKLVKQPGPMTLALERTEDILAGLGTQKRPDQFLIGFAVQDRAARQNARRKYRQKNLDAIVLNGPSAFGARRVDAAILGPAAKWQDHPHITKNMLAKHLIRLAEQLGRRT